MAEEWKLNKADSAKFVGALESPPDPNEAMKAAAARYKEVKVQTLASTMENAFVACQNGDPWIAAAEAAIALMTSP